LLPLSRCCCCYKTNQVFRHFGEAHCGIVLVWRLAPVVELCPLYLGQARRRPYLNRLLFSLFTLYLNDRWRVYHRHIYGVVFDQHFRFLSLCILLSRTVYLCLPLVVFVSLRGTLLSACHVFLPSTLITCPAACSNDHSTCAFVVRDLNSSYLKLKWQEVLW